MTEVCKMTKKLDGIAYDIVRDHFHYYDAGMHDLACKITAALEQAQAAERAPQPCGHPMACVVSSDEGTHYCGWCASLAAALSEQSEAIQADGWLSPVEAEGLRQEIQRLRLLLAESQSVMPKVTVADAIQNDAAAIRASDGTGEEE